MSVTSLRDMSDDREQPPAGHGDGDQGNEEDRPRAPWLPPDDRLWRHPSELRDNPGAPLGGAGAPSRFDASSRSAAHMWVVGLVSGLVGAIAGAGLLLAAGAVSVSPTVVTPHQATATVVDAGTGVGQGSDGDLTTLLDMVEPSIVGLTVTGPSGVETGSGVIVGTSGDDCYVLTDGALFSDAGQGPSVQVSSYWGYTKTGALVAQDPSSGIALVKVVLLPAADIETVNPGSVADIQSGERVFSIGSSSMAAPLNIPDFSAGYIDDESSYLEPVDGSSDAMFSMLVATMSVGTSDYGGALVDASGNLLGIVNQAPGQTDAEDGLTYVTPIDTAMAEVDWMIKTGQAEPHAWFGILQGTDVAGPEAQHMGIGGGVQVDTLAAGSPAARLGIVDSDLVTEIGGHGIVSVGALIAILANDRPGQVVTVAWLHDGHRHRGVVTLGAQPASASPS